MAGNGHIVKAHLEPAASLAVPVTLDRLVPEARLKPGLLYYHHPDKPLLDRYWTAAGKLCFYLYCYSYGVIYGKAEARAGGASERLSVSVSVTQRRVRS